MTYPATTEHTDDSNGKLAKEVKKELGRAVAGTVEAFSSVSTARNWEGGVDEI